MIIVSIVLAFFIGSICTKDANFVENMSNITLFYISCIALLLVSKIYFFKQTRINLHTISKSANRFKVISIIASAGLCILGVLNLAGVFSDNMTNLNTIGFIFMLASGFSMLFVTVLTLGKKIRNQIASSIGTTPILWLVYELVLIFKENLSNPHISEYIFAIMIYIATSLAVYQFTSAFCVVDRKNSFKEYYNLSVFVNIVYIIASFNGLISTSSIILINTLSGCALINLFMLPYYMTFKNKDEEKLIEKNQPAEEIQ